MSPPVKKLNRQLNTTGTVVKNLPANAGDSGDLGQEESLEEAMATHSNILAWKIPWTEEPDGLQSKGSQRVVHN